MKKHLFFVFFTGRSKSGSAADQLIEQERIMCFAQGHVSRMNARDITPLVKFFSKQSP